MGGSTLPPLSAATIAAALGGKAPFAVAQNNQPIIALGSGTLNATGQLTLTTALGAQPTVTCKGYFNASAGLAGGAGLYDVTFSSTTVCQIVGAPATTAGAYAATSGSIVTLQTVVIPGGVMGPNGTLMIDAEYTLQSNANTKAPGISYASTTAMTGGFTTTVYVQVNAVIRNQNSTNVQYIKPGLYGPAGSAAPIRGAADTTVNQNLNFIYQVNTPTDSVILEGYTIMAWPS